MKIRKYQIDKLRNTPVGSSVRMNGAVYMVSKSQSVGNPCLRCGFYSEGIGANNCEASRACLGRYREDRESVVFVRKGRKAR